MKFLIHLIAESKVSQHVQEIACLERKEHRLEEAPGAPFTGPRDDAQATQVRRRTKETWLCRTD
jgi:hypothetical protein